jgi:hypothetical protein
MQAELQKWNHHPISGCYLDSKVTPAYMQLGRHTEIYWLPQKAAGKNLSKKRFRPFLVIECFYEINRFLHQTPSAENIFYEQYCRDQKKDW